MNTTVQWNTSPPFAPAWYYASTERALGVQRYWSGTAWSAPCYADDDEERRARAKNTRSESQVGIEWVHTAAAPTPPQRPDPHVCSCRLGTCIATPAGLARGHVSAISDVRCQAQAPMYAALRGQSVPGMIGDALIRAHLDAMEPTNTPVVVTAVDMLTAAAKHISDRAAAYDKPEGERSMVATVDAFNAITGQALSESEGWLFMECLKAVRDFTTVGGHADSQEDRTAYSALGAEARRAGR